MKRPILAAACLLLLSLSVASPPARAADEPRRVTKATDIVSLWSPAQHLYVKGDIGVADKQLRELETWLKKRPHWTVVLLESAQGERFVDAAGTSHEDIAAVLHALGKGLSNQTSFGSLKHPKTDEPDGTIFLLSVRDRNLSYFASEAQDRRGLGDANWKGQLDAPAIAAMRGGGRILDAVRDTVTSIDEALASSLQKEVADRELARQQELTRRENLRALLRTWLQRIPGELDSLAVRHQELFGGTPPPGVPQANPDFIALRKQAASALAILDSARRPKRKKPQQSDLAPDPQYEQAKSAHDELRATLDGVLKGFKAYQQAFSRLKTAETTLTGLEANRLKVFAAPELEAARGALEQARSAVMSLAPTHESLLAAAEASHAKAETLLNETARLELRLGELAGLLDTFEKDPHADAIQQHTTAARAALRKAREAFERQERSFTEPLRLSEAAFQAALEGLEAARFRASLIRALTLIAAVIAGLALILARTRRNRHMRQAADLHAQWRKALDEKMQALFGLLDRAHLAAGHSREEIQRRYAGTTRERALKLASDVDELFLLSVGASRVLSQAEELLTGKKSVLEEWFAAQLTATRFMRVTRLLRDEPIAFHPDDGIELVLRGRPTAEQKLIGDLASYQPFSLSFEALVEAFNTRAGNALAALDALEAAPGRAGEATARLEQLVAEVPKAESEAVALRVPPLIEQVLPSLEALLAEARSLLVEDPIAALDGPLARAGRLVPETAELLSVLVRGRSEVLPAAERAGAALVSSGLSRQWVDAAIETLTRQANDVARALVERPVSVDMKAFADALALLETRAAEAGRLVEVSGRARAELTRAAAEIETARAGLGQAMGLAPGSMLRERERDPSDRLSAGEKALVKGREALSGGELDTARAKLESVLARVSEADQLVARSREVHARFEQWCQELRTEAQRLAALLAERQVPLAEALGRYLPSALSLRAEDPARPNANGTVQDNLREFASHTKRAEGLLQSASTTYSQGGLLASVELLGQMREQQVLAAHRLEELTDKVRQLQAAEASNTQALAATEALAAACASEVADPRVMVSTQSTLVMARGLVEAARAMVGAQPGDPIEVAGRLSAAGLALANVQRSVANDHSLHARAGESLSAAREALSGAQELVRRAATDGITDSRETTRALKEIEALGGELQKVSGLLDKPHGTWGAVEAEGERIEAQLAREAAALRNELEAAERAVQAIQRASGVVQRAGNWSGSHGVTIPGKPGVSRLNKARGALHEGNYASAQESAERAEQVALTAITQAEEMEARYREAERRREEERERERRRERERDWSSSSSSSFFSSSSSSSSDSGFSSSSWSSSDSSSSGGSSNDSGFGSSSW